MNSFRILVAVKPDSLRRVVLHLLRGFSDIEIVSCSGMREHSVRLAECLLPQLIVVNNHAADSDAKETIAALKTASPGSKLIFTSWGDDLAGRSRHSNADAHINEASLTTRLIPTVRRLCASGKSGVSHRFNQRRYP